MSRITLLLVNLPCIVFVVGGVFLAYHDKNGYVWCFLLSGFCLHTVKSIKEGK